jgi:ATP phosphoribosyltransferase
MSVTIRIGLPKGSLQESTFELMRKAGFNISTSYRSCIPEIDDPEIEARLIRAQEISRYVESGVLDAGITGYDWIIENGSNVITVAELVYSKQGYRPVKWVVAVPEKSDIYSISQLNGKRIATEVVNITKKFLEKRGVHAQVEFSWGATEVKVPEMADAIVELTETGSSLRAHNLRIIETVLESTTRLIANVNVWNDSARRAKIEELAMLLKGALTAEGKVLLKMNVKTDKLSSVVEQLPALHAPTVSSLHSAGWVAVESVVDEDVVRKLIPRLKSAGAEGIIEIPLNKIVP